MIRLNTLIILICMVFAGEAAHAETNLTSNQESILQQKLRQLKTAEKTPLAITFYKPTYVLPFYYTTSPDTAIYRNNTPNEQTIMHSELKAQLSLMAPIVSHLFSDHRSLNFGYTQLSYWQVYAASQYFRETNYEPEIFIQDNFRENWLMQIGVSHQSNGRGGQLERSWNRAMLGYMFSKGNWVLGIKGWALIFKAQSSNVHNTDIAHYLGYETVLFSYKFHDLVTSLQVQNLESGLTRGFVQLSVSYPLSKHFLIYGQVFNGYGQSLIEYNHKTTSAGIGIAFSDWL